MELIQSLGYGEQAIGIESFCKGIERSIAEAIIG
jgi:hypothetical protein